MWNLSKLLSVAPLLSCTWQSEVGNVKHFAAAYVGKAARGAHCCLLVGYPLWCNWIFWCFPGWKEWEDGDLWSRRKDFNEINPRQPWRTVEPGSVWCGIQSGQFYAFSQIIVVAAAAQVFSVLLFSLPPHFLFFADIQQELRLYHQKGFARWIYG